MIYSFGGRVDNDSNAITVIDEENKTAVTTGYVNGEYVEFSSGGGGSSDFSIANVTVVNNMSDTAFPITVASAYSGDENNTSQGSTYIEPNSTASFSAILFNGKCELYCLAFDGKTITLSGDITDDGMNYYIVTGECSITIDPTVG